MHGDPDFSRASSQIQMELLYTASTTLVKRRQRFGRILSLQRHSSSRKEDTVVMLSPASFAEGYASNSERFVSTGRLGTRETLTCLDFGLKCRRHIPLYTHTHAQTRTMSSTGVPQNHATLNQINPVTPQTPRPYKPEAPNRMQARSPTTHKPKTS